MSRKPPKQSGLFESERARAARAIAEEPPAEGSDRQARLAAAALLEIARARHHLRRALSGKFPLALESVRPKPRVGGSSSDADVTALVRRFAGELAAASVMRRPAGPILARASDALIRLERAGALDAAASTAAFERLLAHSRFTHTEVKGMIHAHPSYTTTAGDVPSEMAEMADGLSDDGLSDDGGLAASLIGCDCSGVGALPWYVFSKKGLTSPVVRRRFAAALKAMPPKTRRRVMRRLRAVALARAAQAPSVAGSGWSAVSGVRSAYPSVGRCPYAKVGALTP